MGVRARPYASGGEPAQYAFLFAFELRHWFGYDAHRAVTLRYPVKLVTAGVHW